MSSNCSVNVIKEKHERNSSIREQVKVNTVLSHDLHCGLLCDSGKYLPNFLMLYLDMEVNVNKGKTAQNWIPISS